MTYVVRQDFSRIEKYVFPAGTVFKTVQCVVPAGRYKREFEPDMEVPKEAFWRGGSYVGFKLSGHLHYTQSGLVVGVLPVTENWRRR